MEKSVEDLGLIDDLNISVLAEDSARYDSEFWGQFGLSFLIDCKTEDSETKILFDVAMSAEPILHNMGILGLDPNKDIDVIGLSHCHFDHTMGLAGMLKEIDKENIHLIAHPDIFRTVVDLDSDYTGFSRPRGGPGLWHIGLTQKNSKENIEEMGGKWILSKEPLKVAPGVLTSGEIKRTFEKKVTLDSHNIKDGSPVKDEVIDELAMYLNTKEGLVVVSSCSHSGIVNIVKQGIELTGKEEVRAVIGGFHLVDANEERIKSTVEALGNLNVNRIITGHCTGLKGEAELLEEFEENFEELSAGKVIKF